MCERPSLRCQDLERCFSMHWRLRHQTSVAGNERQQEHRGRHKVEHAVNFKARHQTCTDQWAQYRAESAHQDEPSAYRHDAIGRHAIVRVGDADGLEC